ncbi:MAG: hypothetical protein ACI358_03385 [Candidatus Limimorpha sp.]
MIINILFILSLTFCIEVASTAFNANPESTKGKNFLFILALSAGQGIMYILGHLLGNTFMHLFENISKVIVLILCFMIAFRMVLDTIKIKNGKNLLLVFKNKQLVLLAIALGINTFIAGLISSDDFLPLFGYLTPLLLTASSILWGVIGITTKFSTVKLIVNSLVNFLAAALVLLTGIISVLS